MLGLDTNVLVRFVVQDDKAQAAIASELIENHCSPSRPALVDLFVLCESVWVLSSAYGYSRSQIASVLRQILVTECFEVPHHDVAWAAMLDYVKGMGDYADCVLARMNEMDGASTTVTFDRRAGRNRRFTLLTAQNVTSLAE
jgi:predicted nucleic-acid-binding protein